MAEDAQFTAKVQFIKDPEYIKLQADLQKRQEQETKDLVKKQEEQRIQFGRQEGITRQQLDKNYKTQLADREALTKKHSAEINRYTREYHDAKVIREDITSRERTQKLEDTPKRSI